MERIRLNQPQPQCGGGVTWPGSYCKAEVEAFLYQKLRDLGYDARLQIKAKNVKNVFDIVIFDSKKRPFRIIKVNLIKSIHNEAQIQQYLKHGIPVDLVVSMKQARRYIEKCEELGCLPLPYRAPQGRLRHLRGDVQRPC